MPQTLLTGLLHTWGPGKVVAYAVLTAVAVVIWIRLWVAAGKLDRWLWEQWRRDCPCPTRHQLSRGDRGTQTLARWL